MNNSELLRFYVSCPPGLEAALAGEYHALDLKRMKLSKEADFRSKSLHGEDIGGMEFEGPLEDVYKANLHMRCASRVTVRLGEFIAITFAELRKKASKLDWEKYLKPGQKVSVQAVCHKSRLYHSDAVAERLIGAIDDHFSASGLHCEASQDGQIILVRLVHDRCTISIDSSGELLHKRGYRQAVAKAPIRENLAAGMILASGWDGQSTLIDPFCGSGTIPIEASLLARNIAPGINRPFQFMKWPAFDRPLWEIVLARSKKEITKNCPTIIGFDRDNGAIEMAKMNAARAGQSDCINFVSQAISYLQPSSESGWIITNPPYGIRVSQNKDLRDLYAKFGSILIDSFTGWNLCLLSSDDKLMINMGLGNPDKVSIINNGGIPVKMVSLRIKR